ncbi:MAG TPA: phosphoenolpyruvate carboxylase [Chloroflexota bacterium]|nr:phosphoenolpyruvate carboxylase [Chloroflexota bacterium]
MAPIEQFARLSKDVRLLGELVGDVLREQGGDRLLADVEYVRRTCIALRSGKAAAGDEHALLVWLERLESRDLLRLVRAFATYFHLINLAEEHHRVRALRQRALQGELLEESIGAALRSAADRGLSPERLAELLDSLEVHPVFTAHPSEVRRRSLMHHLAGARALLDKLDGLPESAPDRQAVLDELRTVVTVLWQTAETRTLTPTPLDEVENVLYFLAGAVYDVAPCVERALRRGRSAAPPKPNLLRFGSWVGGDRDGNPNVSGAVTRAAARLARRSVLERYMKDVEALGRDFSVSMRLARISPELLKSIERDRKALGLQPVPQWQDEPYRRKLGLIGERLRRTRDGRDGGYRDSEQLLADLDLIGDSLRSHGAERLANGKLQDLSNRAAMFGFRLAEIEIRQHAQRHADAVDELLALRGLAGYSMLGPQQQIELLERHLAHPEQPLPAAALSGVTRDVLDAFWAVADIQRVDRRACQTYVVSMCRTPADVLAVLYLAREAGLFWWNGRRAVCRLDIVPLFETIKELSESETILSSLFVSRPYRAALAARANRQEVMIGYSDSNKDGGYLASLWHTYRAQEAIVRAVRSAGAEPAIFHGRGGAIGRGGGPAGAAVLARPPGARLSALKLTEQGEVIFARYANPDIAERHLEQLTSALLLTVACSETSEPRLEWLDTMERLAERSRRKYRELIDRDGFAEFFQQATPFPELARLNVASRPVSRAANSQNVRLDELRAIPWGFSWTQARFNLPGWFGLGTALLAETEQQQLREMYAGWALFGLVVDNAQISLATADMATARRYAELAPDQAPFPEIANEFDRTVAGVLVVTGQSRLIERSSFLSRSIQLRNPYVDPLHLAQIALLRRYRALPIEAANGERAELLDAIHHTINGIAAGLQVTG